MMNLEEIKVLIMDIGFKQKFINSYRKLYSEIYSLVYNDLLYEIYLYEISRKQKQLYKKEKL